LTGELPEVEEREGWEEEREEEGEKDVVGAREGIARGLKRAW